METMTKKCVNLLEAASLVSESSAPDGTWKVRLISEGSGSSGVYTAELLENHHHAFDNLLSFKNHPEYGPQDRDFTMISGEIVGETWVEKDERGLTAVYANYLPDVEYREKLERYKHKLGLSIYIEGSGYYAESADGSEEFIVDWFNPEDPYASVDVVIAPGARGKFMESMRKTYDSARSTELNKPSTTVVQEDEGENMEKVEEAVGKLTEQISALAAQVAILVADKKSALEAEAQAEADAAEAERRVESFAAAVDAVEAAELLDVQRAEILESAKKGEDVAPLIENAKKVRDAAIEAVESQSGSEGRLIVGESAYKSATDLGKVL